MKIKRSNIRKKYSTEYISIFMLFFTFFLIFCAVSSAIYWLSNKDQKEELQLKTVSSLTQNAREMDTFIQRVYELSYKFLSNDSVTSLFPASGSRTTEDSLKNTSLVGAISNLRFSISEHVYHVLLYSDTDTVYNDEGVCDFALYFDELNRHSHNNSAFWKTFDWDASHMKLLPVDTVEEKYNAWKKRTVLPIVVSKHIGQKRWTLVTEVNVSYIAEKMARNEAVKGQGYLCIDGYGNVVLNTTNHTFSEQEITYLSAAADKQPVYIDEQYLLDGMQHYLVAAGGLGNLRYFVLTPQSLMDNVTFQSNQPMMLFFLMTMVIFFILTLVYTHRLYHPLKSVIQLLGRIQTEPHERIQKQGSYLYQLDQLDGYYKRKEEALFDSLNDAIRAVLIEGKIAGYHSFQKRLLEITGLRDKDFYCLAIQFEFRDSYYESFSSEEQELVDNSLGLILTSIVSRYFPCYVTEYARNSYVCLFNRESKEHHRFAAAMQSLRDLLKYDVDYCNVAGGLSSCRNGGDFVYESMMEAVTALGFSEGQTGFCISEYAPEKVSTRIRFTSKDKNLLVSYLKSGEKDMVIQTVNDILRPNKESHLHHSLMQQLIRSLYDVGYEYLFSAEIESKTIWEMLNQAENPAQNVPQAFRTEPEWLKAFLVRCAQAVMPIPPDNNNIEQLLEYITHYYREDLYLERIADQFSMNPKYLSRLFKEKTGINMTEYINMVRITKAKELLTDTDLNIIHIGEEVGFENRTTFFRVFKKMEGVSPNEYRKINRNH